MTHEEINELLISAPKTLFHCDHLAKAPGLAEDVVFRSPDLNELYELIGVAIKEYQGWVMFVRHQLESSPRWDYNNDKPGISHYLRLQFCKPEDLKTI